MEKIILILVLSLIQLPGQCQKVLAVNNNLSDYLNRQGSFHELFKLSLTTSFRAGSSFGASYGMWKEGPVLQYGLNTGFMWRFGSRNLGNYLNALELGDRRSRNQFVFMFSPLLTTRLSKQNTAYQEIEPFYFQTPNAVFSKFKHSVTLGTTFTVSPRGYKNVTTVRNRAQQVFVLGINVGDFNFTIYDDFFPILTKSLQLGDNWDRFFTGGGFVRYRFSPEVTLHIYSEVYTGINRANPFLYPDLIAYRKAGKKWVRKNMAYQDPGQEFFNDAWFSARISYTSVKPPEANRSYTVPNLDFFAGTSASWAMFSQNLVHSIINDDRENNLKHHFFLHRTNVPGNLKFGGKNWLNYGLNGNFIGVGTSTNISNF